MIAKDVKHGMLVALDLKDSARYQPEVYADHRDAQVWEVLERSPHYAGANPSWWLHRREADGTWNYAYARVDAMKLVSAGSREEMLIT